MENRDQLITEVRPSLNLSATESNQHERFQNECLRPILKLQNYVFVLVVEEWLVAHKQILSQQAADKQANTLTHILKTNRALRAQLFGIVCGMMTIAELKFYLLEKSECNRRITSMLIQRLIDQMTSKK
ncbi:MAG: hypothetical protein AAFY71_04085 [Bacteroidota bacterium]